MEKKIDCNLIAKKLRGDKGFSIFGKPINEVEWKEELEEISNLEKKLFEFCYKDGELYKIFINRILILIEEIEKDSAYFNPKYVDIDSYRMYLEGEMMINIIYDDRCIKDDEGRRIKYI